MRIQWYYHESIEVRQHRAQHFHAMTKHTIIMRDCAQYLYTICMITIIIFEYLLIMDPCWTLPNAFTSRTYTQPDSIFFTIHWMKTRFNIIIASSIICVYRFCRWSYELSSSPICNWQYISYLELEIAITIFDKWRQKSWKWDEISELKSSIMISNYVNLYITEWCCNINILVVYDSMLI